MNSTGDDTDGKDGLQKPAGHKNGNGHARKKCTRTKNSLSINNGNGNAKTGKAGMHKQTANSARMACTTPQQTTWSLRMAMLARKRCTSKAQQADHKNGNGHEAS